MMVILFKVALVAACGLLGAWALRSRIADLPERAFIRAALALQLVPTLGLFCVLYVVGHQAPTSDVPTFYVPAANAVLAGKLPFRDFTSSYAPGFAYVGAVLAFIWDSGKAFALFDTLLNAVALTCWHSVAALHYERKTARHCTILYATSGHALVQALLGTNQSWVAAGLAGSALLISREREAAAGFAQAIAACTTKVLAHLFWPLLWICSRRRTVWLLAAVVPAAALYGAFIAAGAGPGLLYPLRHEGALISPGNVPYVLDLFLNTSGALERVIDDGLSLVALAATTVWLYMKSRQLQPGERQSLLLAGLALTGLVFMLFSKKSFTGYVIFAWYPIVLMLVMGTRDWLTRVAFLFVFNALLVAEPSLWFYFKATDMSLKSWLATSSTAAGGFLAVDVALLACYAYLAWLSVRCVGTIAEGAIASRNTSHCATACSLV
jgi:hypothetical protein